MSQTEMLLSKTDIKLLEKAGYDVAKFARYDSQGYARLRNVHSNCFFYDKKRKRCREYHHRPLGCRIYPVVYCEEEGVIVDNICPMRNTVSGNELERKGKSVIRLLGKIDLEAITRVEAER